MTIPNHERVGKALDLLREGLRPYVERAMTEAYGAAWQQQSAQSRIRVNRDGRIAWDLANLLKLMWDRWLAVFEKKLAREDRALVSELISARNRQAHREHHDISNRDAYRVLDSASRLLRAIGAEAEANEAERLCEEMLGVIAEARMGPFTGDHVKRDNNPSAVLRDRVPKEAAAPGYWVYENWTHEKAVIHRSNCSYCNEGRGIHPGSGPRNGRWHGPFPSFEAAHQAAARLPRPLRRCAHCTP